MRVSAVAVLVLGFIWIGAWPAIAQAPASPQPYGEATPPSNDDFDEATLVSSLPYDDYIDTRGATGAPDDPACDGQCATVWYRHTPEEARAIGATTWGSDYDTTVLVFKGTRGALELVAILLNPSYRVAVEVGTTYHFLVLSRQWDLSGGHLRFSITNQPPLSLSLLIEPVAVMDKPSGVITLRGQATCSSPAQVYVGVRLERHLAQRYLTARGFILLTCTDHSPFEVDVQTYDASRFGEYYPPGQYSVTVFSNGFDLSRGEPADAYIFELPILVRGAPSR